MKRGPMSVARRAVIALSASASVLVATAVAASGCITDADQEPALFACPDATTWPVVSQVLERKCGTLDCHGDRGRPLRFFGRNGARLDDGDEVGTDDGTTAQEIAQNRASCCGLEPEQMAEVVEADGSLESLTLVRKPLLLEAHKGGRVWLEDSPGYICLRTWIEGAVDEAACEAELSLP